MFTIRIKPKENECLTSYLYRLANENKCKMANLIVQARGIGKKRVSIYTIPTLDFSPLDNFDMSKLAIHTGLEEKQLLSLSIHPFHTKFNQAINLLNREWETRFRRFCPCCLKEDDYFKIYWQVKEIDICLVHKVKLRDSCCKCNYKIPYIDTNSVIVKECPECGSSLKWTEEAENYPLDYINDQQRKYKDWMFLISEDANYDQYHNYSIGDSLISKYLYFISLQKNTKDIPIPYFTDLYTTLINSLKTKKRKMNRNVTPLNLLRTLRHYDVPIREFYNLKVPEKFIDSLLAEPNKKEDKCLAPWCKSFGTSASIIKANLHRSSYKYSNISKCKECNLTYGLERRTGKWTNTDGLIKIYDLLTPYLEELIDINKLIKYKKKVSEYKIYYLLGYLLNQPNFEASKINFNCTNKQVKQYQLKCLLSKTKHIPQLKSLANTNYGWDSLEFFYLYHSDVVQRHIYFEMRKNRTQTKVDIWNNRVSEYLHYLMAVDEDITIEVVCRGVGCSPKTLSTIGVNNLIRSMKEKQRNERNLKKKEKYIKIIDNYIQECLVMNKKPNCKEIYSLLEITVFTFKKNHPDIYGHMKREVDFVTKGFQDKMLENWKLLCKKSIQEIEQSGENLTYIRILSKAGLGHDYCRRYSKLREYVDNEIKN